MGVQHLVCVCGGGEGLAIVLFCLFSNLPYYQMRLGDIEFHQILSVCQK